MLLLLLLPLQQMPGGALAEEPGHRLNKGGSKVIRSEATLQAGPRDSAAANPTETEKGGSKPWMR